MLNTLKTLTAVRAVSGREKAVSDKILKLIAPLTDSVRSDAMGSLIAFKKGTGKDGERRRRMLCAHMDEIGFLVTFIDDNGYLRIAPIGGINFVAYAYSLVEFANGVKGILVPESGTAPADLRAEKFYIDIGAKDKKEAEKKVKIGDYCAVEGRVERLVGKRVAGRPFDDRIGCAMLIKIAEALQNDPCEDDVYFVFAVQEEVGLRGSKTAAYGVDPDSALNFDVTLTGDSLGSKPMACSVGGGAAIKVKDSSLICDAELTEKLISLAKEKGIKSQCEILLAGGTDTASVQVSRAGVRVGAISVPTRYIHTGLEMMDLNDVTAGVELAVAWLHNND